MHAQALSHALKRRRHDPAKGTETNHITKVLGRGFVIELVSQPLHVTTAKGTSQSRSSPAVKVSPDTVAVEPVTWPLSEAYAQRENSRELKPKRRLRASSQYSANFHIFSNTAISMNNVGASGNSTSTSSVQAIALAQKDE